MNRNQIKTKLTKIANEIMDDYMCLEAATKGPNGELNTETFQFIAPETHSVHVSNIQPTAAATRASIERSHFPERVNNNCPDGNPCCDGTDLLHGDWCGR
ncbi:MAG: hypothetical protein H0U53_02405 [Actinobacteria bacterium]|nr:hypothetical protein [Actinomycetota bacterium]